MNQKNIISSTDEVAKFTDSSLINPWGIASVHQGSSAWVVNNGTATLVRYNLKTGQGKFVSTPNYPTGIVLNRHHFGFFVTSEGVSRTSRLIIVTEGGIIAAYNEQVDENNTITVVDNSNLSAKYKGVTQIGRFLYVANFYSGQVEKYDEKWGLVGTFTDTGLVSSGYSPFNVASICNNLFVAFAKQDSARQDNVAGAGNGYIDVFDNDGKFKYRFASRGALNSPWAMLSLNLQQDCKIQRVLMVGNFGDGTISLFDFSNGQYLTSLKDKNGNILYIDGLWGLEILNNRSVLFSAGSDQESAGLLGKLKLVSNADNC